MTNTVLCAKIWLIWVIITYFGNKIKSAGFPNICYITKRFYLLRTEDFNDFDPGSPYGNNEFIFIMHIFRKICLLIDSTFIWILMLAVRRAIGPILYLPNLSQEDFHFALSFPYHTLTKNQTEFESSQNLQHLRAKKLTYM